MQHGIQFTHETPSRMQPLNKQIQDVQEPLLLEPYRMINRSNEELIMVKTYLQEVMASCNQMLQDRTILQNPDLWRDALHLCGHLEAMYRQWEGTAQTMERLANRRRRASRQGPAWHSQTRQVSGHD